MPEDTPEYSSLCNALEIVQKNLQAVNESKREVDNLMDLIAIQDLFVDKQLFLQAKGRRLIMSNEFRKVYLDSSVTSPSKITVWLLSDMLIFGKLKEKGKYYYKCQVPTSSVLVWDLDPSGTGKIRPFPQRNSLTAPKVHQKRSLASPL